MEKYGTKSDGKLSKGGGGKTLARILGVWGDCPSTLPEPVALGMCKDYYASASESN